MTPQDFIAEIGPAAQESAKTTRIPASFTVAEAALESGWDKSELALKYFNIFGVKADAAWHGRTVVLPTKEHINGRDVIVQAKWRVYESNLASLLDHAQFLLNNPRYKPAFSCMDGKAFAMAVAAAGYATDPLYASKIISIIDAHNLLELDALTAA